MGSKPRTWYHTIDLPDGSTTPGWIDTRPLAEMVPWPASLKGGRCLDVGTFDGFWSFEMERRGAAEVVAIDVDDPEDLDFAVEMKEAGPEYIREVGAERGPGFAQAKAALGSAVTRKNRSVYDLDPAEDGQFDVVFIGSLLVHLRDPLLGLEKVRGVCKGSLILTETVDPVLEIVSWRYPAAAVHPWPDQWWAANSAGIESYLTMSGYEISTRGPRYLLRYGPGGPKRNDHSWLTGIAARKPGQRGIVGRIWVAKPLPD